MNVLKKKKNDRLFLSFSGGETSAYMTAWCMENLAPHYNETLILFANTGQENEETLRFVKNCQEYLGWNVVWLEAKVDHRKRKGTSFSIVDFDSACRDGAVFEEVIKKYGIPNHSYPHCTRELKLQPMTKYLRSIGWKKGSYDVAVGIRIDEIDRMSAQAEAGNIFYPLISLKPMTKPDINTFWEGMPFRLNLKGYQGNCKWCWKKSDRKHFTIMDEDITIYDFPKRMEELYGLAGANRDGNTRKFFMKHRSTKDMIKLRDITEYEPAWDDSVVYNEDLDVSGGCTESCEVNFEELGDD